MHETNLTHFAGPGRPSTQRTEMSYAYMFKYIIIGDTGACSSSRSTRSRRTRRLRRVARRCSRARRSRPARPLPARPAPARARPSPQGCGRLAGWIGERGRGVGPAASAGWSARSFSGVAAKSKRAALVGAPPRLHEVLCGLPRPSPARAQVWASRVCCCSSRTSASSRCTTSPSASSSARG